MTTNDLIAPIRALHAEIRAAVVAQCERAALEELSAVSADDEGDTIYAIDRVSERALVEFVEREIATHVPVLLIAEGLEGGQIVLPRGTAEQDAVWRIITDPIDGTRGLMFQKRSAWILTGLAPNRGAETTLADIELAVQTEIPLVKQHLSDCLWAVRGAGMQAERFDRLRGDSKPIHLHPSRATTIAHGFAGLARFFPGAREILSAIDDEIAIAALGPIKRGKALCFEDQYISSGGQLYELICGHDRFTADVRPLVDAWLERTGTSAGICCHPYDLCTELIAREAGVSVCDPLGGPLHARLCLDENVAWAGYANPTLRAQLEPLLIAALKKRGLA